MSLNKFLYRNSIYFFVPFLIMAFWAFWPGYYSRLFSEIPRHIHIHGISMTLWCLLLIAQALLVRFKKNKIHKVLGKFSYLLVPVIFISGFNTAHAALKGATVLNEFYYTQLALMFNSLIAFIFIYGLAIYNIHKPLTHARFMVSTLFPILTPITDRLIYNYAYFLIPIIPTRNGIPMAWVAGFLLADIVLIGLSYWDWRTHKRLDVFPLALGLVLCYQLSVLVFYNLPFWRVFGDWLMSLPLS